MQGSRAAQIEFAGGNRIDCKPVYSKAGCKSSAETRAGSGRLTWTSKLSTLLKPGTALLFPEHAAKLASQPEWTDA